MKELLEKYFKILNLDNNVIEEYCKLYTILRKQGVLLPDSDLLIAATALAYSEKLITKDKSFEKLKDYGLNVQLIKEII